VRGAPAAAAAGGAAPSPSGAIPSCAAFMPSAERASAATSSSGAPAPRGPRRRPPPSTSGASDRTTRVAPSGRPSRRHLRAHDALPRSMSTSTPSGPPRARSPRTRAGRRCDRAVGHPAGPARRRPASRPLPSELHDAPRERGCGTITRGRPPGRSASVPGPLSRRPGGGSRSGDGGDAGRLLDVPRQVSESQTRDPAALRRSARTARRRRPSRSLLLGLEAVRPATPQQSRRSRTRSSGTSA